MCVHDVYAWTCVPWLNVEVRGQFFGVGSFLPSRDQIQAAGLGLSSRHLFLLRLSPAGHMSALLLGLFP